MPDETPDLTRAGAVRLPSPRAAHGPAPELVAGAHRQRDHRLDILRGVAVVLVLLWHLQPLGRFHGAGMTRFTYVANWQVSLVAVPVLFTLSLYLFALHGGDGAYLLRRCRRLAVLVGFYFVAQIVVYVALEHRWPALGLHQLVMGGPSLPLVGDSIFYFLTDLLALTVLMWLYLRLPGKARVALGVAVVAGSAAYFELRSFGLAALPYYHVLNFVVYVPVAYALGRSAVRLQRWFWLLAGLYVASTIQDLLLNGPFSLTHDGGGGQMYGRLSLVAGALVLLLAVQRVRLPRAAALEAAGRYSLGVFALHKWVWLGVALIAARVHAGVETSRLAPVFIAAVVIPSTAALVALLRRRPLRFLVSGG